MPSLIEKQFIVKVIGLGSLQKPCHAFGRGQCTKSADECNYGHFIPTTE